MSAFPINNLRQLSIGGESSFSVRLPNGSILFCEKVVRRVPNKRLVCLGAWGQQVVYAKLFIGNDASRYCERDNQGIELMLNAGIVSPKLLYSGLAEDGKTYLMILEAITSAKNAEEVWCQLDTASRFSLAKKLVQAVAGHHQAGLLQTDLYFKNFLVKDDLIYTLDGDGIRQMHPLFQKRQKLQNLATLFSKMDVLDDVWIAELYRTYCLHLDVICLPVDVTRVRYLTQKIRYQVASGYANKKVFRTCTDVKVAQSFKRFEAVASGFSDVIHTLASLDCFLADTKLNIKNGNTCTVGKALIANQAVVIKRYNIKNFWHGLSRAFRASRAAKSWASAHQLIISNIATPKPLALIEERFGCIRRSAYYLSAYIDAPDALQFFAESSSLEEKKTLAGNIAILFFKLYLLRISHGDCKATNIKVVDSAPVLIDLDAMHAHSTGMFNVWFERKHVKDLKRLMNNWVHDAEVTALLKRAFVLQYAQASFDANDSILFRAGIT